MYCIPVSLCPGITVSLYLGIYVSLYLWISVSLYPCISESFLVNSVFLCSFLLPSVAVQDLFNEVVSRDFSSSFFTTGTEVSSQIVLISERYLHVIDTAKSSSAVSLIPESQAPRYHWYRGVKLSGIIVAVESDLVVSLNPQRKYIVLSEVTVFFFLVRRHFYKNIYAVFSLMIIAQSEPRFTS